MGTSKEQEMLIIIPIFNHYNWFLKVVHSQISSLYLTRSWRVKLHVGKSQSSSEALQSSLGKQKPELLCITCCDLTPCAHPESGHTAEVTALLCSSLGWMFAVKARNWHEAPRKLWGNGSLNKWKQYTERKAGPDKDLLDHLTKKALEPHTAWKPVQKEAQQPLFCSVRCGDTFRHMTPGLVPPGVQRVSMVQKWQKQQIQLQKSLRPFFSSPSIIPSLLKYTVTDTESAQWQQRDCVIPHSWIEWPHLNTFQLPQKRAQSCSPRTPGSVSSL